MDVRTRIVTLLLSFIIGALALLHEATGTAEPTNPATQSPTPVTFSQLITPSPSLLPAVTSSPTVKPTTSPSPKETEDPRTSIIPLPSLPLPSLPLPSLPLPSICIVPPACGNPQPLHCLEEKVLPLPSCPI